MPDSLIDLRSDTATRPTPAMREAMARAEVGDASLGEDPTTAALERRAAGLFGKEAALYVASGTMANQLAIKTHTQPGDEIISEATCHPVRSEMAAAGFLSGVQFTFVPAERGIYGRDAAEAALRPKGGWHPRTALLWAENTHNAGGGAIFPLDGLGALQSLARDEGIPLHMDGARIFNAVVATGIPPEKWGAACDTMNFCLSKGLGCPVGSVLLGSADFIARARRYHKIFGGVWRQAGIIAAAGLHALDHHIERLAEDHANAQRLAEMTAGIPGVRQIYESTPTNIVYLDVSETGKSAQAVAEGLRARGVALSVPGKNLLRAVTHLDVDRAGVERAAGALSEVVA